MIPQLKLQLKSVSLVPPVVSSSQEYCHLIVLILGRLGCRRCRPLDFTLLIKVKDYVLTHTLLVFK